MKFKDLFNLDILSTEIKLERKKKDIHKTTTSKETKDNTDSENN